MNGTTLFRSVLAMGTACFWAATAIAQGDDCATAVAITPGAIAGNGPATGGGAVNPPCTLFGFGEGAGTGPNADWFKYTPALNGTARVLVTSGTDTHLSVFTGTCGSLTCLTGDDDISGSNFLSDVMFPVQAGTTYYIQFDDFWDPGAYTFSLTFTALNAASAVTVSTYPYTMGFPASLATTNVCGATLAEPAGAGIGWINHSGDGADWYRRNATTPSSGGVGGASFGVITGPNNGVSGVATDTYLYLEASQSACATSNYFAVLTSPIFSMSSMVTTGQAQVSWYDHMWSNNNTMGRLIVQFESPANAGNWTTISSKNNSQGTAWNFNDFTTLAGASGSFRLRFIGWRDSGLNSFNGDMAIDQIVVRERPDCTSPVASVIAVNESCNTNPALSTFTIDVQVSSYGTLSGVPNTQCTIVPSSGASQVASGALTNVYTFGPYTYGTVVTFNLTHQSEPGCNSFISGSYRSCCSSTCATAFNASIGVNANTNTSMTTCGGGASNAYDSGAPAPTAARWWTFTPASSGIYTIESCAQAPVTNTDTRVSIHTGSCGSLSFLLGDDDGCTTPTFASSLPIFLNAGTTYYIEWDNAWNSAGHTWSITGPVAPIPGDECTTALPLTMSPTCSYTTASTAGASVSTPSCAAGVGATTNADIWFSFTATSSLADITVAPTGTYYPILELLDGSSGCGSPTSLCCTFANAAGTTLNLLRGGLTVGNTYFLRIGHAFAGGDGGLNQFSVCVVDGTAPTPGCTFTGADYTESEPCGAITNSDLCTAETITLGSLPFTYTIGGSIQAECNFRDRDFYAFTLASTATYQIQWNAQFASRIFFLDANGNCADPLVQLSSAASPACTQGTFTQSLAAGTYALMMTTDGIFNNITCGTTNDYEITITAVPNLDCDLATPISCGDNNPVALSGTGLWSTNTCGFLTPGNEALYLLNVATAGTYNLTVISSNNTFIDYFYKPVSAGCSPTGWTCIQDIAAAGTSVSFTITTPGQYWILADAEDNTVTSTQSFRVFCPPAAVSTDYCSPIAVNCGDNVSGQTTPIPGVFPANACPYSGTPSTGGVNYWSITPASDAEITLSTCGSAGFDTRISVYLAAPDCNNLECVALNDDGTGCPNFSSEVSFAATGGVTYTIAVHGYGADFGFYTMSVLCGPPCTPGITNDACSSATALTPALNDGTGVPTLGDNSCAHGDANSTCDPFGAMQGMWYAFNSGPNSIMFMDLATNAQDVTLTSQAMNYALYDGGCDGLGATGEVDCVLGGDGLNVLLPALTPNTDYLLYLWNNGGVSFEGSFSVLLRRPGMNDAGIDTILSPDGTICTTALTPMVRLHNHGESTLTSVSITYDVDGGPTQTFNWTGSLAYDATIDVSLPTINTTGGNHTLNVYTQSPNGSSDEIPSNDGASKTVDISGESCIVSIRTDNNGGQISWMITDAFAFPVANGGPYPGQNNEVVNTTVCLPTVFGNCYSITLMDAGGDGLCCLSGNGSWELQTLNGRTLLRDEFSSTSGSTSPNNPTATAGYGTGHDFCLPAGPSSVLSSECNIFTNNLLSKVYTQAIGGVLNYQFEFSDPDAGFRRRIGVPRPWVQFSEMQTSPLTPGTVYFCRVRADQGATGYADDHFGTGCEMALDPATVGCTQLIDNPSLPTNSCGVTKTFGGSDKIWAQPKVGATQYRFRFVNAGLGYSRSILRPSYVCLLSWVTQPLVSGNTYDVSVEVLVNNVWSGFCGAACQVTIGNVNAFGGQSRSLTMEAISGVDMQVYPNPTRDRNITLRLGNLRDAQQRIVVELYDAFGKRVMSTTFENTGSQFIRPIELESTISAGVYMMNVSVNGVLHTTRLSVL